MGGSIGRLTVVPSFCLLLTAMTTLSCFAENKEPNLRYTIDFTQPVETNVMAWLKHHGFRIALDADDIKFKFNEMGLVMSTNKELAGLVGVIFEKDKMLNGIDHVVIEWGVTRFPAGANWEEGNNRVAIAAMVFFGTEKISSGLPFGIHAAPYFISPFLGEKEPYNKVYTGALYKQGGRYVNVNSNARDAKLVVSRINVKQLFEENFDVHPVPPVSIFAFQMNTKDTDGDAEAFIKTVKFYSAD